MNYYIVAKGNVIDYFKSSKLFTRNLGRASTKVESSGIRSVDLHGFEKLYNSKKQHFLFSEGNVGSIKFYSNPYMVDDVIAVYDDEFNELKLVYDFNYMNSVSINSYLGEVMKEFNKAYYPTSVDDYIENEGDADKLYTQPWAVKWEDIKAYFDKKKNV